MNLGENIFRLRSERNMSQGDLADALDVSRQSVSKWENNSAIPDLEKLIKLSDIFEITLDQLVGKESPVPQSTVQDILFRDVTPPHRIVGVILLCFGLLTTLLLSILGGFCLGVMAGLPFTLVGCVLISSKQELLFKSAWVIFAVYAPLCYYFILNFVGIGLYSRLFVFLIWFGALILFSIYTHRKGRFSADSRKLMVGSIIIAIVLLILLGAVNGWMNHRSGLQSANQELAAYAAIEDIS